MLTDEDSANENDSGLVNNLSGRQLAANAEAGFNDGHRTSGNDDEIQLTGDDKATFLGKYHATENDNETHNALPTISYKTAKWSRSTFLTLVTVYFPKQII